MYKLNLAQTSLIAKNFREVGVAVFSGLVVVIFLGQSFHNFSLIIGLFFSFVMCYINLRLTFFDKKMIMTIINYINSLNTIYFFFGLSTFLALVVYALTIIGIKNNKKFPQE